MVQKNNKIIIWSALIVGIITMLISIALFFGFKFELYLGMQETTDSGRKMIAYFIFMSSVISFVVAIYYYVFNKKLKCFYENIDVKEKIVWEYSETDKKNKIKNIIKRYKLNLVFVYVIYTFLVIKYYISEKRIDTSILILYFVIYGVYFVLKIWRKKQVEVSPKEVIFSKDFIIYENQSIFLSQELSRLKEIYFDLKNNELVFLFKNYTKNKKEDAIRIYVPLNKQFEIEEELNKIRNLYIK